jgi:glycosyltransferase involved in cell wall biosynthesis
MDKSSVAIIYIITKLELGGAQKVCLSLAKGLQDNVTLVYLISGAEGYLIKEAQDKCTTILLPTLRREVTTRSLLQEIRNFIILSNTLYKLRKMHTTIIVHTHSTKAGIIGRWAAWFAGIKLRIHTIHGYGFHPFQKSHIWWCIYLIEYITSFITTHFICVSEHDITLGKRLLPHFLKKHSLIRACVDQEKFLPLQNNSTMHTITHQKIFIFGTVACFKPQKNLLDLLRAFSHAYAYNPLMRLEIIGDGILRNTIEEWISQAGLQSAIKLHGWQHDVTPFMEKWHAFTLTSLWEGLPCAIIEARLLMLPVIAYDVGGINEIIQHGTNGLLYQPTDWLSFAQGMITIFNNTALYKSMRNYTDNLNTFSATYTIEKHKELYKKILGLA